jgi:peptidoglycan/LPS O-acetylase OafA/YrhL
MARKLLVLNGLATIGVALHHAAAYTFLAMFEWTDRYLPVAVPNYDQLASPAYYILLVIRQLIGGAALPAFFFVSGYFVAFLSKGRQAKVTWDMILPRIKFLIIPFLAWTTLRFLLIRQYPTAIGDVLDPYYFVTVLIQCYALAPVIVAAAQRNWKVLLLLAGTVQIVIPALRLLDLVGITPSGLEFAVRMPRWIFLSSYPFWFPLGVVCGLKLTRQLQRLETHRYKVAAAAVALGVLVIVEYLLIDKLTGLDWVGTVTGIVRYPLALAVILTFMIFELRRLPGSKELTQIGTKSLGIYLANIPSVYVVALLMYHLTPALLGLPMVYFTVLVAAGLGIPLLLMASLERSPVHSYFRYVFG